MIGLTGLIVREPPLMPELKRKRALFVLSKIDSILAWENSVERDRDRKFVDLGHHES